jgi:hypothetical protein
VFDILPLIPIGWVAAGAAIGARLGTWAKTHSSKVMASVAVPVAAGNTVASSAGILSMTVSRVSMVVP